MEIRSLPAPAILLSLWPSLERSCGGQGAACESLACSLPPKKYVVSSEVTEGVCALGSELALLAAARETWGREQKHASVVYFTLFVRCPFCAANAREGGTDRRDAGRGRKGGGELLRNDACLGGSVSLSAAPEQHVPAEVSFPSTEGEQGASAPGSLMTLVFIPGTPATGGGSPHCRPGEMSLRGSGRKGRELGLSSGGVGIALVHLTCPGHCSPPHENSVT